MKYSEMEIGWKIALWIIIGLAAIGWITSINDAIEKSNNSSDCIAAYCVNDASDGAYCSYHRKSSFYSIYDNNDKADYYRTPDTEKQEDIPYYDNDWLYGEDYFDIEMYGNPEDFYDDYYDDFWDYEEAEEYYYSHGGQ